MTEHVYNEEVLRKQKTKRKLILRMRKIQLKFPGHPTRKLGFENLRQNGYIKSKWRQGETAFNLYNNPHSVECKTGSRMDGGKSKSIKIINNRKFLTDIIAHIEKGHDI